MLKGKKDTFMCNRRHCGFKAAALTSKLTQSGAIVKVMMSESAMKFVTPLTFQALSRHDVYTDTFDEKDSAVIAHIDLADWADVVLVAPATANCIGKLAGGIADDMITTTLLATTAPVWIAPAMNVHMYENKRTQQNINILKEDGYHFIEPGSGFLACGYVAKGRMEEPLQIVSVIDAHFQNSNRLANSSFQDKRALVTAGPTIEVIDPVRFVSNRSSGKMGYAIAEALRNRGAIVTLVTGPTTLEDPKDIEVIHVQSAEEMFEQVTSRFDEQDIVVKAAAVSDYTPVDVLEHKMKKQDGDLSVSFKRTKDILKYLGEHKTSQYLIGFAAETEDIENYAQQNYARKMQM